MAKIEKCGKCKIHHQGFHVCLDLDPAVMAAVARFGRTYPNRAVSDYSRSEENVERLREATKERHMRRFESNKERDEEIIKLYKTDEWTMKDLCERFKIGRNQLSRVLHEAQDNGEIVIRPRGQTIRRWPQPA